VIKILKVIKVFLIFTALTSSLVASAKESLTDDQIKQLIINESIASYPSVCACPYSVARNGSSCGARSAYSKPGGYDPICYKTDVTKQMLVRYKRKNNL
jgi:hypothetical protein